MLVKWDVACDLAAKCCQGDHATILHVYQLCRCVTWLMTVTNVRCNAGPRSAMHGQAIKAISGYTGDTSCLVLAASMSSSFSLLSHQQT